MELHCDGVHIKVEEDRTSRGKDHRLENKTLDSFWNNQLQSGVAVSSIKRQGYTTSKTRWGYSPGPSCTKAD